MQLKCILLQKYLEIPCIDICLWTSEELSYRWRKQKGSRDGRCWNLHKRVNGLSVTEPYTKNDKVVDFVYISQKWEKNSK